MAMKKYPGKYRAVVVNVHDPEERGRVQVYCPNVYGEYTSDWCEMSLVNAVDGLGDFFVPPVGAAVLIEFEDNNPDFPIYSGGWYSSFNTPPQVKEDYTNPDKIRIIGFDGAYIIMKDGKISLEIDGDTLIFNNDVFWSTIILSSNRALVSQVVVETVHGGNMTWRSIPE